LFLGGVIMGGNAPCPRLNEPLVQHKVDSITTKSQESCRKGRKVFSEGEDKPVWTFEIIYLQFRSCIKTQRSHFKGSSKEN